MSPSIIYRRYIINIFFSISLVLLLNVIINHDTFICSSRIKGAFYKIVWLLVALSRVVCVFFQINPQPPFKYALVSLYLPHTGLVFASVCISLLMDFIGLFYLYSLYSLYKLYMLYILYKLYNNKGHTTKAVRPYLSAITSL